MAKSPSDPSGRGKKRGLRRRVPLANHVSEEKKLSPKKDSQSYRLRLVSHPLNMCYFFLPACPQFFSAA
ncbi:Uncharacterized protein HZ326_18196 [Fusarium oxysporum f. sp. albedinis]|nr:Uncharacterized protein HZ326_18196 [Fusarium oxysporum f. sp. albedinis]